MVIMVGCFLLAFEDSFHFSMTLAVQFHILLEHLDGFFWFLFPKLPIIKVLISVFGSLLLLCLFGSFHRSSVYGGCLMKLQACLFMPIRLMHTLARGMGYRIDDLGGLSQFLFGHVGSLNPLFFFATAKHLHLSIAIGI